MEKEIKYSTYDEATISKMLDMFTEVKDKINQVMVLQDELAWLLYAGKKDLRDVKTEKTIVPDIPVTGERRDWPPVKKPPYVPPPPPRPPTPEDKVDKGKGYAFCNSAGTAMWHIRRTLEGGRTLIGTQALCGEPVFWGDYIPIMVVESNIDRYNVCMQCAREFRREQGVEYVNKETDRHKQEG